MISATTNYNKTNFGMAVKTTPEAVKILEKNLTPKGTNKLNKIIETQKNNPIDIHLKPYRNTIFATVAGRKFYPFSFFECFENSSRNIIKVIRKAAKYADTKNSLKNINIQA